MRKVWLSLFPPVLVLVAGLVAIWVLLQNGAVLDLRWPFGLWVGLLPLIGGYAAGYRYPDSFGRAGGIVSVVYWLLVAGGLFFLKILPDWRWLGLLAVSGIELAWLGAWLGSGFALARREGQGAEEAEDLE